MIDTHAHVDGEEFATDLDEVMSRAKQAGVTRVFVPAINATSIASIDAVCQRFPRYCSPMMGLQPEEVGDDYRSQLDAMRATLPGPYIAIGEVGLDFYWTREHEREQLQAFEQQLQWSIELRLPLMIHCRKAQNEMLALMRPYRHELVGGVFHCFTGNEREAERFLDMEGFCLGIGGVLTFKSSHLREVLPTTVPLSRIVLETDSPYMAPVPHRGTRNEPRFVADIAAQLARCYGIATEELSDITDDNVRRLFPRAFDCQGSMDSIL